MFNQSQFQGILTTNVARLLVRTGQWMLDTLSAFTQTHKQFLRSVACTMPKLSGKYGSLARIDRETLSPSTANMSIL
jgi:hypothetical protein